MTSLQKQIDENADSIERLLEIIKKLEERIIALERAESVVHILPTDSYYWEHG
jgi:hypothetical protein